MAVNKIMCACASGLGFSVMVQMNIDDVLKEMGVTGIEVVHATVADVEPGAADLFVVGRDLASYVHHIPEDQVLVLDNIVDKDELRFKLQEKLA